jgi:hypothetical protein
MGNVVEFLESFRSKEREITPELNPRHMNEPNYECLELFLRAAQEINKRYLPGTISYVGRHHPDLDKEIDESELAVNKIWFAVERGEATIKELRDAIAIWYRLNLKAIAAFSSYKFRVRQSHADVSEKSDSYHE